MQYDIDRMQYEMNDLRRRRIASNLDGSTGNQIPDDFPGKHSSPRRSSPRSTNKETSPSLASQTSGVTQVFKFYLKGVCNKGGQCDYRHPQACLQKDKSCKECGKYRYAHSLMVSAGGDFSNTSRGRSPSVKKVVWKQVERCRAGLGLVRLALRLRQRSQAQVGSNDEIDMIFLKVENDLRQYACGGRRRPLPKPRDLWNADPARMTLDIRDSLRAIRLGRGLADDVTPKSGKCLSLAGRLVTLASTSPCGGSFSPRSNRWVIDSGSCIDTIRESTITDCEQAQITIMGSLLRLHTANGEVLAAWRLQVPLRSSTSAGALIMKVCPYIRSLAWRCMQKGFSFVKELGAKPILRPL